MPEQIQVSFTAECVHLMRELSISHDRARVTINDRHRGLVTNGDDRIVAVHWFGEDDIVLVDSLVKENKRERVDSSLDRVTVIRVEAQLVIALRSTLPAGKLYRKATMEQLLRVVAKSFGQPVICHPYVWPLKFYKTLYTGPWNGKKAEIKGDIGQASIYFVGSFYRNKKWCSLSWCSLDWCELVWAFNLDRYRRWLADSSANGFVGITPISSRAVLEEAKVYVKEFPQRYPNVPLTSEAIQFGLAAKVLRKALGDQWYEQNLLNLKSAHPLRVSGVPGIEGKKRELQLVELAEKVFNLQSVPGFDIRLKALKTEVDIKPTLAELETAKLLIYSEIRFEFVEPTSVRGLDYEAKLFLPSGIIGSCEVKIKSDTTSLNDQTIFESLKKAGKQAPNDRPLIVFIKIPNLWLNDPKLNEATDAATKKFFKDYSRSIAVVFFWDEWLGLESDTLTHLWKYREIINEKSRFYDESNADLVRSMIMHPNQSRWISFRDLAEGG